MPLKNNSMFYQALVEAKYFIMGCLMIMHLELPVMSNRITKSHSPMSTAVIHCKMEIIFQGADGFEKSWPSAAWLSSFIASDFLSSLILVT